MEERKGFLTPDQEKILDELIKFDSTIAEKLDGVGIQLIDNQGLERLKGALVEKYPDSLDLVYQIIDALFEGLETLIENKE